MNKFYYAVLYGATVKNLRTMKLQRLLEVVVTKAFGNCYLRRKLPEKVSAGGTSHIPSFSFGDKHTHSFSMYNYRASQKLMILINGTKVQQTGHWEQSNVSPIPCAYHSAWGIVLLFFLLAHVYLLLGHSKLQWYQFWQRFQAVLQPTHKTYSIYAHFFNCISTWNVQKLPLYLQNHSSITEGLSLTSQQESLLLKLVSTHTSHSLFCQEMKIIWFQSFYFPIKIIPLLVK